MTLEALLAEARSLEISKQQAADIESPGTTNAVLPPKSEIVDKTVRCFNCGESWPHDVKAGCPARNRKCNSCRKVSLVGEAEQIRKGNVKDYVDAQRFREPGVNQVNEESKPR